MTKPQKEPERAIKKRTFDSSRWTGRRDNPLSLYDRLTNPLKYRLPFGDRLDTRHIGPWWLRLTWTNFPRPFASYSLRFRRKLLLSKPIDYEALS